MARPRKIVRRHVSAGVHYEPSLTAVFLPGCRGCGSPHPLALKPPLDVDACPGCGAPVGAPGEPQTVRAVLTGWGPYAAASRALIWIGQQLLNIAKGL